MNLRGEQEEMKKRTESRATRVGRPARTGPPRKYQTYFVLGQMTDKIKIGRAIDPASRLKDLQTGSPDHLTLIAVIDHDCEKSLHRRFREYHSHGEWYFSGEILKYLKLKFNQFIQ